MTEKWGTIYLPDDSEIIPQLLKEGMTIITYTISNVRVLKNEPHR